LSCSASLWGLPRVTLALGLVLLVGAARPVHAQERLDFSLELARPDSMACMSQASLEQAIEARVDRVVFLGNTEPSRRIHVQLGEGVEDGQPVWRSEIVMRAAGGSVVGERVLTTRAGACDELDEALVVVISTLIGIADPAPEAASRAAEPDAEARPSATSDATRERAASESDTDTAIASSAERQLRIEHSGGPDAPSEPIELSFLASARLDLGYLPGPAFGPSLGVQLDFGKVSLKLSATYFPYTHRELDLGAGATMWSITGDARVCLEAAEALATVLSVCTGLEAGFIRVVVTGLGKNQDPFAAVVRARFGPEVSMALSRSVGITFDLGAVIPLLAPRYYFIEAGGQRRYYHSVGLGLATGVGVRFSS
jgi:hypothetical protein